MLQKSQKLSFLRQNLKTNKTSFTRGSRPPPNKADKSKVEAKRERSESPEIEVLDQLTSKEKRNHFPIAKKPRRQSPTAQLPPGLKGRTFPNAQIFPNAIVFGENPKKNFSSTRGQLPSARAGTGVGIPSGISLGQGQPGQRGRGSTHTSSQRIRDRSSGQAQNLLPNWAGHTKMRPGYIKSKGNSGVKRSETNQKGEGGYCHQGLVQAPKTSLTSRKIEKHHKTREADPVEKRRGTNSGRVDLGFQNTIAAAFAKIPQEDRSNKRAALGGKLAVTSVDEEEEKLKKKKKLDKFVAENVKKAAIVTAEGR